MLAATLTIASAAVSVNCSICCWVLYSLYSVYVGGLAVDSGAVCCWDCAMSVVSLVVAVGGTAEPRRALYPSVGKPGVPSHEATNHRDHLLMFYLIRY